MFDNVEVVETIFLWQTVALYMILTLFIAYVICLWLKYRKRVQICFNAFGVESDQLLDSTVSDSAKVTETGVLIMIKKYMTWEIPLLLTYTVIKLIEAYSIDKYLPGGNRNVHIFLFTLSALEELI